MKAMILAAGLGTRLRPLTEHRPKALVEIGGRTLLEITLARLRDFGIQDVIVNVHHFAGMIQEYLKSQQNFGMNIAISIEDLLLDTGGGLKRAAAFFLEASSRPEEPFIVHNVDVLSSIDLSKMVEFHQQHRALATLAVQDRESSRYLLFEEHSELCGRRAGPDASPQIVRSAQRMQALAFCGIQVIAPRFLTQMSEEGAFSIIDSYLRGAAGGERIVAFRADEYYWRDLGTPESVAQAARDFSRERV